MSVGTLPSPAHAVNEALTSLPSWSIKPDSAKAWTSAGLNLRLLHGLRSLVLEPLEDWLQCAGVSRIAGHADQLEHRVGYRHVAVDFAVVVLGVFIPAAVPVAEAAAARAFCVPGDGVQDLLRER